MNTSIKSVIFSITILFIVCCSTGWDNKNTSVLIKTSIGDITVRLYDETPGHRDNFIKLVTSGTYDGVSFHRVIKGAIVQGGDPETNANYVKSESDTMSSYTIPAEFNSLFYHKKGALAAARYGNDVNPQMRSSGTQFYIVQGKQYSDDELVQAEKRIGYNLKQSMFVKIMKEVADSNQISGGKMTEAEVREKATLRFFQLWSEKGEFRFSDEQRNAYKTIGGMPRLDNAYTVFGEVVKGLEIVDKIADAKTDESDKPVTDIRIIKMKLVRK